MANTPNINLESINILSDMSYAYDQIVTEIIGKSNSNNTKIDTQMGNIEKEINSLAINLKSFGVKGDGVTDDTIALNDVANYVSRYGGKVIFKDTYLISGSIIFNFLNDVTIEIDCTPNSLIVCKNAGALDFYNPIVATSETYIGSFKCKVNIEASQCGTGYGQLKRMQGITATKIKNVDINNCNISNLYGTGIFVTDCVGAVYVGFNKLTNVWGYNPDPDSYGDGVYIANIVGALIEFNNIYRNLNGAEEVGRVGVTIEFDAKNCTVRNNIIHGYNRAIHVEASLGGHNILQNTITACPVGFVWAVEKGANQTVFQDNVITTEGFIHKDKTLTFYDGIIQLQPPAPNNTPSILIKNNKVTQVKANKEVPKTLAINTSNVKIEQNEFVADINSLVGNRQIYAGSQTNLIFKGNKFVNIGVFVINYVTNVTLENNQIQCESVKTEYSKINIVDNVFTPTGEYIGSIIGERVNGYFIGNIVKEFSDTTIRNTLLWNNLVSCEISKNTFERNKVSNPTTPCTASPENKADTLYTLSKNTIKDNVLATTRDLIFYHGWYERNGKRIIFDTTIPDYGTWNVGDEVININPTAGGYMGWVRIENAWKGYGLIQD